MLALSFTFLGGRYHATPWDRHVNEGAVAWPPAPWRILRALIATWHHKVKHREVFTETTLLGLVEALAQDLPEYRLPAASHSHTRHYMPQFAAGKTSLVFDAFTAVKRNDPLTITWPHVDLPDDQAKLLDDLLTAMGYLGRAESWVEAKRIETPKPPNCMPGCESLDLETGEWKGDIVNLFAPLPAHDYQALRDRFLIDKKASKKLSPTLPESLLDALSVDTYDLRKQGWNQPPAARKVSYLRPVSALRPVRAVHETERRSITAAQFVMIGKPLPRVEDSLRIGELLRMAVMSQAKRLFGEDHIPAIFSGHDMPESNRHGHAFYLPWDSDGDSRLDRILMHVPAGMNARQRRLLEGLNGLWSRDGSRLRLVLENTGTLEVARPLICCSTTWQSVTPYLHPWYAKKRFTIENQIRRECRDRGLPEPVGFARLEQINVGRGRKLRPIQFHRFRNRRGLAQPDRLGSFWRLTFPAPIPGPLALGFACHFGLGLFKPDAQTHQCKFADIITRMPNVGSNADFERRQGKNAPDVFD